MAVDLGAHARRTAREEDLVRVRVTVRDRVRVRVGDRVRAGARVRVRAGARVRPRARTTSCSAVKSASTLITSGLGSG